MKEFGYTSMRFMRAASAEDIDLLISDIRMSPQHSEAFKAAWIQLLPEPEPESEPEPSEETQPRLVPALAPQLALALAPHRPEPELEPELEPEPEPEPAVPTSPLIDNARLESLGSQDMDMIKRKLASLSFAFGKGQDPHTLFSRYDRDKSGQLDFVEFRTAVRKGGKVSQSAVSDADLQEWFSAIDGDASGEIGINELAAFVWGSDDRLQTDEAGVAADSLSQQLANMGSSIANIPSAQPDTAGAIQSRSSWVPVDAMQRVGGKPSAKARQPTNMDTGRASQLHEIFARADRDGDGRLTRAELILWLRKDEELRELLKLPAHVGDGERDMFEVVFQGMDVDADGCVTAEEFVRYLGKPAAVEAPQSSRIAGKGSSNLLDEGPPGISAVVDRGAAVGSSLEDEEDDDLFGSVPTAFSDAVALTNNIQAPTSSSTMTDTGRLAIPDADSTPVPPAKPAQLKVDTSSSAKIPSGQFSDLGDAPSSQRFLTSVSSDETSSPRNEILKSARSMEDMFEMAVRGEVEAVRALVRRGVHIDTPDENGCTPLDWACHSGDSAEVVMVLLDGGAQVDTVGKDGESPLHRAARRAHLPILNMLLRKGAPTSASNTLNGRTPLHSLAMGASVLPIKSPSAYGDAANMLLRAGASLTETDSKGRTPRALACLRRRRATDWAIKHAINATINAIDYFVAGQRVHAKVKRVSSVKPSTFDQLVVTAEMAQASGAVPIAHVPSFVPASRETMIDTPGQKTPVQSKGTPARRNSSSKLTDTELRKLMRLAAPTSAAAAARTPAAGTRTDDGESTPKALDAVFEIIHNAMELRRAAGRRVSKLKDSRQTFEGLDDGKTGRLDASQFREGLLKLGLGLVDRQIDQVVAALTDGAADGLIDYNDFAVKAHTVVPKTPLRMPEKAPSALVSGDSQSVVSGVASKSGLVRGRRRVASNASSAFGKGSRRLAAESLKEERNITEEDEMEIEQLGQLGQLGHGMPGRARPAAQLAESRKVSRKVFLDLAQAVRQNRSLYGKVLRDNNALFEIMDKDCDGVLSVAEFGAALRRLGLAMNHEQTRAVLQSASSDGQENITHADFVRLMSEPPSPRKGSRIGGSRAGSMSSATGPAAHTPPRHVRTLSSTSLGRLNLDDDDHSDVVLPVLQALIWRLEEMKATPTMELFRAPGSFSELEVMHQQLVAVVPLIEKHEEGVNSDALNVLRSSDDVHTIAALLLRWVRESRGPLLPPRVYSDCAVLIQSPFADAHEAAMAVRMFVAEQSDAIAKPLLMLTDFLRGGGQQHLQQLAELFVPALFRPVGAVGGVQAAVEFTARLMGKVESAPADELSLEAAADDTSVMSPPVMPSADDSQSIVSQFSPAPMLSPCGSSPPVGTTTQTAQSSKRRKGEGGGIFGCCGSRKSDDDQAHPGGKRKHKRKSAPGKMESADNSQPAMPSMSSLGVSPVTSGSGSPSQRRHPSKPSHVGGSPDYRAAETPQPKQMQTHIKRVVFGSARSLGLVLGSQEPLDKLWLELDVNGDGQLGADEVTALLIRMGRPHEADDAALVMKELDADGSGEIDIGEFEDWYVRQPERTLVATKALAPVFIHGVGAYAAKRGLRPGMRVLTVQAQDTRRMSLRQVSKLLANAGRPLTLEVGTEPAALGPAGATARTVPTVRDKLPPFSRLSIEQQ